MPQEFTQTNSTGAAARNSVMVSLIILVIVAVVSCGSEQQGSGELVVFCAAVLQEPMDELAEQYYAETGVRVSIQYGGSNTLLSQLMLSESVDVYIPADQGYGELAAEKNLIAERHSLGKVYPVVLVKPELSDRVGSLEEFLREELRVVLGNPEMAAIGKVTQEALEDRRLWEEMEAAVRARGTFMPTVNEVAIAYVANDSMDAAIVWSTTAKVMDSTEMVIIEKLTTHTSEIEVMLLNHDRVSAGAAGFVEFLRSAESRAVLQNAGFLP